MKHQINNGYIITQQKAKYDNQSKALIIEIEQRIPISNKYTLALPIYGIEAIKGNELPIIWD